MTFDSIAMIESIADTALGFFINFPLSWVTLIILLSFTTDPLVLSIVQTFIITLVAIIRKYITRIYFKSIENE